MPRLISNKRYQRLVEAEKKYLSRPAIVEPKPQQDNAAMLELVRRLEEYSQRDVEISNHLITLAKFMNPTVSSLAEAIAIAEKFKK
jgi:hypothetical protein